ncbi:MAG: PHB depolymerase family esterase [bacterium]
MFKIRIWVLFLMVFLFSGARGAMAQGIPMTWQVDGVQREAIVFAPKNEKPGEKHPLVFGFHGHGGNMNAAARGMHFQDLWPEAIVVYPQGLPTVSRIDPAGLKPGWQTEAGQNGDRDLKFFDAMLGDLKKKYKVDEKRIYSAGFSNGSIFSYLLWADRAKTIAAIGVCTGRMSASVQPTEPKPVIFIGGETDRLVPLADLQANLETIRKIDQATGTAQSCGPMCSSYASKVNAPVMAYFHPGGHVFPPWAAQAYVDFFKSQK